MTDTSDRPPLSDRETEVLRFIEDYIQQHPWPPTFDEIISGTSLQSRSTCTHTLDRLETKGYIFRQRGTFRTIKVLHPAPTQEAP